MAAAEPGDMSAGYASVYLSAGWCFGWDGCAREKGWQTESYRPAIHLQLIYMSLYELDFLGRLELSPSDAITSMRALSAINHMHPEFLTPLYSVQVV